MRQLEGESERPVCRCRDVPVWLCKVGREDVFKKYAASHVDMPQCFQLVGVPKMKYLRLRSLECETR